MAASTEPSATPAITPRPKGAGARFFWGAGFFWRGFGMVVTRARLAPWILMPTLLTIAVTFFGSAWAWHALSAYIDARLAGHGAFVATLIWILLFFFIVTITIVGLIVVSMVAAAPFVGQISEKTERIHTGAVVAPKGLGAVVGEALRGLGHTLLSMSLFIVCQFVVLGLQLFLSFLAPLWALLGWWLTGYFLAYDAFDLPLSRRGKTFADKWAFLSAHTAEGVGFGMMVGLLVVIPFLGLVVIPIAACGGTLMFLEIEKAERAV